MQGPLEELWKFNNMKISSQNAGLGVIEIVVVIAVILTVFAGILQLTSLESTVQAQAREESKAYLLARETMEAARFVRDEDSSTFFALTLETSYYPVIVGSSWTLALSNPGAIDGFTRRVVFHEVFRDGADDIAPSGTSDPDTLRVEVIVEWVSRGSISKSVTLEAYLTNWQAFL